MFFDFFKKKETAKNDWKEVVRKPVEPVSDEEFAKFEDQFTHMSIQSLKFNSMVIEYLESIHDLYDKSNIKFEEVKQQISGSKNSKGNNQPVTKMLEKIKPAPIVWPNPVDSDDTKVAKLDAIINNKTIKQEDRSKALKMKFDILKNNSNIKEKKES